MEGFKPIDFPFKMVLCKSLASICHFLGLGPSSSKGHGYNLRLSSNRIALFHGTLELGPSSKVALKFIISRVPYA